MDGIVIVGGSAEAHGLARALPEARVWLPEPERVERHWPGPVRHGPLAEALAEALVVVDASHACDAETAWAVAGAAGNLPRLQLVRPGWRAGRGDRWVRLRRVRDARLVIPTGARVLVTLGRAALPDLRGLRARLLVRQLSERPSRVPVALGRAMPAAGPFDAQGEARFLRRERVDWVLLHDAGGSGAWPKLAAARRLGLPVAVVDRPRRPDGPRVESVAAALDWLEREGHLHG